jgi:hypothetical protein
MTLVTVAAIAAVVTASVAWGAGQVQFGSGTFRVGLGAGRVHPGTYRSLGGAGCYWERLRNFSGGLNSILANDNAVGPVVVTILKTDRGFDSEDCGRWTSSLTRITKSTTRFGQGTYIVGIDIRPGTYQSSGGSRCYWSRLRNFTGGLSSILANDNPRGHAIVTISRRDKGFSSAGCGTWRRF